MIKKYQKKSQIEWKSAIVKHYIKSYKKFSKVDGIVICFYGSGEVVN